MLRFIYMEEQLPFFLRFVQIIQKLDYFPEVTIDLYGCVGHL